MELIEIGFIAMFASAGLLVISISTGTVALVRHRRSKRSNRLKVATGHWVDYYTKS